MYDFFVFLLKAFFVVIVFFSIAFGVILPLIQGMRSQSQRRSIESPVQYRRSTRSFFLPEEEEVEIPTSGDGEGDHQRDIIKLALEDPNKTALLVRNWIQEKQK